MVLFASQCEALKRQLQHIRLIHQQDLAAGGEWVFPRRNRWKDATGKEGRTTWIQAWSKGCEENG
jgi:nitrous oxide reductase accessory protein NosL